MGTAIFVGLGVLALVVAGFLMYGLYLGLLRLATALVLSYRWLVTPLAEGRLAAGVPHARKCWEVRRCPPEARGGCPAYRKQDVLCWVAWMQASETGSVKAECLGCTVFSLPQMVGEA